MADDDFTRMENVVIKVTTDGRPYEMTMGDFSAMEEMLFKQTTGEDLMKAFSTGELNSVIVAGMVWLFRRRYEKKLQFRTVAEKLTYADLDTLELKDLSEDEDDEDESSGDLELPRRPEGLGEISGNSSRVSQPSMD